MSKNGVIAFVPSGPGLGQIPGDTPEDFSELNGQMSFIAVYWANASTTQGELFCEEVVDGHDVERARQEVNATFGLDLKDIYIFVATWINSSMAEQVRR